MLKKLLYIFIYTVYLNSISAQCPQIYDYLGNLSSKPYFVSCTGASSYQVNFSSNTSWGPYTINWGDGTANTVGASYTTPSIIQHTYHSATPDTFVITLSIPALNCTLTGVAVMEKPVNASIQIPIGGVTTACAPKALQFTNSSTDVSKTTVFTWNYGDGSPTETYSYTNANQTVTHTYNKGTVNCQTQVTLKAKNYCTPAPTIANFNPIQIYDLDNAAISANPLVKCWPDATFTYSNTTGRNCVPQGNTFQRQEKWFLGNYWGLGHDSIVGWKPWPPTSPMTLTYPSVGNYTVMLVDSNLCGVDTAQIAVSIVNPPTAGLIAPAPPLCQGSAVTFTNTSSTGYVYKWNFGAGGGFVTKAFGPQTYTYNTPGTYTVLLVAAIAGAGATCTDTEKVVINILPRPTASYSMTPNKGCNQIIGAVFTDNSTGSPVAWNWNFGNGNTFSGQTPPPQDYNGAGNYVATLTVTAANTCVNTFSSSIKVYQKPIAIFSPVSGCVSTAITFSDQSTHAAGDPIISYTWDFGDGSGDSHAASPVYTYSAQNLYNVMLEVETANCRDTGYQNVSINIRPTASYTYSPINGCTPLLVTFTNTSINATSYTWNFGNGQTSSQSDPTETFTNTTGSNKTYTVTLKATTGSGCSDSVKHTILVYPKPTATFVVGAPAGCSPVPATFTNTSTGANSFDWDFGDMSTSTSTLSVISHTYLNTTLLLKTYTVQLIATNSGGCKDTVYSTVTAYPKPIFNFTMTPNSGCTPLSINFPPVLGAISYTWNFGDGSPVDNSPNPTHVFTNSTTSSQTYTVQLIASNAFSCVDTTYGYPVVFHKPNASFINSSITGCSPVNITFTNTTMGANTYTWSYGDGSPNSNLINSNHVYTNTTSVNQTFTVQLLASNTSGCSDTAYVFPDIAPKPNAIISYSPSIGCSPLTVNFSDIGTGASTYTWNLGDGSSSVSTSSLTHVFTNTLNTTTTYSTQLWIENAYQCSDTASVITTVYPKPNATFSISTTSACSPILITYTNSTTGATTYTWDYGDGSPLDQSFNPTHQYVNTSSVSITHTVQMVATNSLGCTDTAYAYPVILPKPDAAISFTPGVGCSPLLVNFNNTDLSITTYTWNFGDGSPIDQTANPSHTYNNSTISNITYSVELIVGNTYSCFDTSAAYPLVYPKPHANFSFNPLSGCSPLAVTFTNNSTSASSYLWKYGDGAVSTQTNTSYTYINNSHSSNQSFLCTLIAETTNGCKDSLMQTITVYYKPSAQFNVDTPSCSPKVLHFSNTSLGGDSYHWDFGNSSVSTSTNPTQQYINNSTVNESYTIELIASTSNNCQDTVQVPIVVHPKPEFTIVAQPDTGCSPLVVNFPAINGVINYQWNFGDGNQSTGSEVNNVYFNLSPADKTFTVQLIASDVYGCKDTSSHIITVYTNPVAYFNVTPYTVYLPSDPIHCINLSSGAVGYYWNFGDGGHSTQLNPDYVYHDAGQYQIYLVASNLHGCVDTFNLPVFINVELETGIEVPNAFSPNPNGSNGGAYADTDTNNDVFHPVIKGIDKYEMSIYSRWGELLFVTKDIKIGWDGYYKGQLCTQDVYVWKINATTLDGKKINKTGDLLLLR